MRVCDTTASFVNGRLTELEVEEQEARKFAPSKVDKLCLQMASVHAQLILTVRNIAACDLRIEDVRTLLLSFMYLQRRHVWNQPKPEPPMFELPVSEPQLFDIMQCSRRAIVQWLDHREKGETARQVQELLHDIFEIGTGDLNHVTAWARFNGTVNTGRYATVLFRLLGADETRPKPPPWLQRVNVRQPDVEVNIQLLQVMMRGRFLTALQDDFKEHPDFQHLFGSRTSTMQVRSEGHSCSEASPTQA